MMLNFVPLFVGQIRGFSIVGFSAWTYQDVTESDIFELLAQKAGAGRVFQEWNETGEPPPGADWVTGPGSASGALTPSGLWREVIDEGINTYFSALTPGQKIEAVKFDRPSANQQKFKETKLRETFYAAGWSLDFGLNPTTIGGAPLRVVVDRINASVEDIQCEMIEPAARRFDAFRIPVAMLETKELPFVSDWWNLEYQPGARLTGDRKYDSDVTIQDVKSVDRLFGEAEKLAKKYGIPFAMALERLEQATPNGNVAGDASAPAMAPKGAEDENE